jgi:Zn-dependent peptidase ImmA (M78 family)/lambda repressor-like predicted transcriptional regulator
MLNPSRLTVARMRRGWTLKKLADEAGISTKSLSTYENAHQEPSEQVLEVLANKLEVDVDFLTGDDLDDIPLGAVSFRALSKMTARTRDRGLASGRIAVMINDWIEDRFTLPKPDLPTLTGHAPEAATEELRARWGLGEKPIGNLIHLLEAHGVRIYSLTHENTDLDAFCLYWHGQPFMFLGTEKSAERSRFDAAHELGHLVLHGEEREPHGAAAEQEANQFAAAFLMPRSGVLAQRLRNAPAERILVAKRRWNVAAMALAHRTNELGLMTEWCYRSVCVNLSRMGYRRGEPAGMGAHESSQLLTKVLQQLRTTGSGIHEIAADLRVQPSEVQAHMFGLTPIVLTGGDSSGGGPPSRRGLRIVHGERDLQR